MKKVAVVTGATGGMGSVAVRLLAGKGWRVVAACRDIDAGNRLRDLLLVQIPDADIDVRFLDLTSFKYVDSFVNGLPDGSVDVLFNNAGVMNRYCHMTGDGYENTLQTNFLGPAALISKMLPCKLSQDARIVNMVSLAARYGRIGMDSLGEQKFSQLGSYADSKCALLVYSAALAERLPGMGYPGISVNVSDPWIVDTEMIRLDRWFDSLADRIFRPICFSPERGVRPAMRAMDTDRTGCYFVGGRVRRIPLWARRHSLSDWLWKETQKIVSTI